MKKTAFSELKTFITEKMRMSHIYQPVMLRVLFQRGGRASREDIAKAFLEHDRSQIDYYAAIVGNMPGRVLTSHGIVERDGHDYRLTEKFSDLTAQEKQALSDLCDARLANYLGDRGQAPWQHRKKSLGYISGSLRYDIIQKASGRCEACGISVKDRALEIDHIVPRNKGGTDDRSNLQALCYLCNAQKRDRDDTDYAAVQTSYDDRDKDCVFCHLPTTRIIDQNELAIAILDMYAVTACHTLIIPRRQPVGRSMARS